jgi:hypothetical protein
MTGPRPAGRPWTRLDDRQLAELAASGMKGPEIARKLKRTVSAVRFHTRQREWSLLAGIHSDTIQTFRRTLLP